MAASDVLKSACLGATTILSLLWLLDVPIWIGSGIIGEQFVLVIAGLAVAAGFLGRPYGRHAGAIEIVLAIIGIAAWCWAAWNYADWLIAAGDRGPHKWIPGLIAIVLLLEALRRNCGGAVAGLMAILGAYGFVGHWFPGVFEAEYTEPRRMIMYLYADSNGIPGLVLNVATTIVLAFIVFSKCLEATGAGQFFDDISMAALGNYRGGPAKVAVVSSSLFGIISGSSVANVVSSGIVTIPLMKRYGFRASFAGAVEAVSSNAGQITPPVMGTTAFLIAEFLQIPYSDVVLAAIVPSAIFYVALFIQVDSYAAREGLHGVPRGELPRFRTVMAEGWIFVMPIVALVYFMFWTGLNVSKSALYAAVIMVVLGLIKRRRLPDIALLRTCTIGVGEDMLQILLVSAGAGIVIGVLNLSGLSFTITLVLTHVGENAGTIAMISITAVIAVILGMGMPTAAVYVLLSVVLGPALVKMGIEPLAAHMFIFYFGLMSMLTPPVAMASYAAASLAGSDLWRTSVDALKLGASGYLLPFVFVLNPALLLSGSWLAVTLAIASVVLSAALIAWATEGSFGAVLLGWPARSAMAAAALLIGTSTIWFGRESFLNVVLIGAGTALMWIIVKFEPRKAGKTI
jgi:TRAP transporter 4TM/12TM fusion protein